MGWEHVLQRLALIQRLVLIGVLAAVSVPTAFAQGPRSPTLRAKAHTEEAPIEVDVTGQGLVEAGPGEVFSVGFLVRNRTDSLLSLVPTWTLPPGWQVLTPPAPFEVAPRTQALRLLSVRVARRQPPGTYPLRYTVRERAGDQAGNDLLVRIGATRALRLEVAEVPRYVSAGHPYTVRFLMHNDGNEEATVRLSVESRPFDARVLEEVVTVTANTGRSIDVVVAPPRVLTERTRAHVSLLAQLEADSTVVARTRAEVDVIPGVGRLEALRPRWGLEARVSALGGLEEVGTQAEVRGRLPLSGDSAHVAEVDLRPPASAATNYTQAPVYVFRYLGPHARAMLGTGVYALSPLTNAGRYGVGARLAIGTERLEGLGLYRTTTNAAFPDSEVGGAVRYDAGPLGRFSLNAVHGQGASEGEAVTVRGEVPFHEALVADVEAGASHRAAWQPTYRVGLTGRAGLSSYSARIEHRGRDFPGATWGLDARAFSASTRILSRTYGMFAWSDERLTSALGTDRRRQLGVAGLSGYLDVRGVRAQGGVELRYDRSVQPLSGISLDRGSTLLRFTLGATYERLYVSTRTGFGRVRDADSGAEQPLVQFELETGWREGPHRVHTHFEYTSGATVVSPLVSSQWAVRVGGEEHLSDRFDVRVDLGGGSLSNGIRTGYGSMWVALGYRLPRGRRLVGEVQGFLQHHARAVVSTSYRLSLEVPLSGRNPLPLRGNRLEGFIVDERTGVGIADVLVSIGNESALTDEQGRFAVPSPPEGRHYLFIDRISLGLHRVPTVPIPYPVEVPAGGAPPEIRIPVSVRTILSGRVRRYEVQGGAGTVRADTVDIGPAAHVVVEVEQGTLRHRQQTDGQGRFAFNDLPPGRWAVRVVQSSAPTGYTTEGRDAVVELVDEAAQDLRLLPPPRQIRMLDGGLLQSNTGSDGRASLPLGRARDPGAGSREALGEAEPDEERDELGRQVLRVGGRRP